MSSTTLCFTPDGSRTSTTWDGLHRTTLHALLWYGLLLPYALHGNDVDFPDDFFHAGRPGRDEGLSVVPHGVGRQLADCVTEPRDDPPHLSSPHDRLDWCSPRVRFLGMAMETHPIELPRATHPWRHSGAVEIHTTDAHWSNRRYSRATTCRALCVVCCGVFLYFCAPLQSLLMCLVLCLSCLRCCFACCGFSRCMVLVVCCMVLSFPCVTFSCWRVCVCCCCSSKASPLRYHASFAVGGLINQPIFWHPR